MLFKWEFYTVEMVESSEMIYGNSEISSVKQKWSFNFLRETKKRPNKEELLKSFVSTISWTFWELSTLFGWPSSISSSLTLGEKCCKRIRYRSGCLIQTVWVNFRNNGIEMLQVPMKEKGSFSFSWTESEKISRLN